MKCDKKMEIIIKKSDIEQKYIDFFNIKPNKYIIDNYYENLEWVSIKENNKHGFIHGFVDYTATSETRRLNKVYEIKDVELYCDYISKGFSNKEILDICKYTDKKQRRSLQLLLNDLRNKKSWVWVSNKYF